MLKTAAQLRSAFKDTLSDVQDKTHKEAFLWWLPHFLPKAYDASKEKAKGMAYGTWLKEILDKLRSSTHAARDLWYRKRVGIMQKDHAKEVAKTK